MNVQSGLKELDGRIHVWNEESVQISFGKHELARIKSMSEKGDISRCVEFVIKLLSSYKEEIDKAGKAHNELIREGVARARARGAKLGNPRLDPVKASQAHREKAAMFRSAAAPLIEKLDREGLNLSAIARELNQRQIPTARGASWHASSVRRVLLERKTQTEQQTGAGERVAS